MANTQTIDTTTVQYHYDREARPAINVKVYARFDSDVRSKLEAALNPPKSAITSPGIRVVKEAAEKFNLDVDALYEQAFEELQRQWWDAAAEQAETLGLGPIEAEGRSGGWLVFTDGRDPQEAGAPGSCYYCGEPEGNGSEHNPDTGHEFRANVDRTEWLAAYAKMAEWCSESIKAYSADLDRAAVALALDVAQSYSEPEETALTADEFAKYAGWAHQAGLDSTIREVMSEALTDERIESIVSAVWGAVAQQHERTADVLVDVIEKAAGPEIMAAIEALEGGAE